MLDILDILTLLYKICQFVKNRIISIIGKVIGKCKVKDEVMVRVFIW